MDLDLGFLSSTSGGRRRECRGTVAECLAEESEGESIMQVLTLRVSNVIEVMDGEGFKSLALFRGCGSQRKGSGSGIREQDCVRCLTSPLPRTSSGSADLALFRGCGSQRKGSGSGIGEQDCVRCLTSPLPRTSSGSAED